MQNNVPFDKRLKRIVREHDKMEKGTVKTVTSEGLIVAKPRVFRPRFPLKGLIVLLIVAFTFKGFLFAFLGEAEYAEHVNTLQQGTVLEQAGSWIMQADPATRLVAEWMAPIVPR